MARITVELLRRRAEHNEGQLTSLKEVALHQFHIERIELLGECCRHLQILYLQDNLIPKIENLNKLKELKYLNLAVNNIEKVENLEACESLEKLDLTANFIADLPSVRSLAPNYNLRQLYLIGNPCCKVEGYRHYVIGVLPQLKELDGREVTPSERITAAEALPAILHLLETTPPEAVSKTAQEYTPEYRREMYKKLEETQKKDVKAEEEKPPSPPPPVQFKSDGKVLQMNQGEWDFHLREAADVVTLDVAFSKFLDTSLIQVDCQPKYVRITAKSKVLQLNLPDEVKPDAGTAERSRATGHLLLTLPKVHPSDKIFAQVPPPCKPKQLLPQARPQQQKSVEVVAAAAPKPAPPSNDLTDGAVGTHDRLLRVVRDEGRSSSSSTHDQVGWGPSDVVPDDLPPLEDG
eukprot:TRINITY_DN5109_c0_g1_i1.p1 TRINITY_DN5109_c0_g1~~TRINITY_DN5109_c0_g1_i1.p1  ORF type:complete len:414 (+),score=131.93 TRINITY_DN5109_c0_g1_i1:26-1243(+)